MSASKPFPAKTGEEYMTIGWKWTFHEVGASESKTQSLGSSTSDLFLTFETASPHACKTMAEVESAELPEGSRETEPCTPVVSTLLNEGCCGLQPPPANEAQRILRVWGWFNKRGPIRPGGIPVPITFGWTFNIHTGRYESPARPISYYSEIGPGASAWDLRNIDRGERCFDREQMLAEGTGRCGAWADWLVWAISTWGGARVAEIGVVVNSGAGRECGSGEPESCILLVKNWGFRASTPTRNAAFPYWSTAPVDLLGVPGQNIENPPPYFWDHALVRAGEGAAAALFDPSYGNGPFQGANKDEVLQNYQNASIDGYCRPKDLGGKFRAPYECRPSSSGSLLLLGVKGGMEWPGWP